MMVDINRKDPGAATNRVIFNTINKTNYTQKPAPVKRNFKKILPPNGKFYLDVINGVSQFPNEAVVLIYIGKDKSWEYASSAKDIGLQPPIVIDVYINPKAYIWPVQGLRVRVIEWSQVSNKVQTELAVALYKAGAIEIQYQPFGGLEALETLRQIIPNHEPSHKLVSYA